MRRFTNAATARCSAGHRRNAAAATARFCGFAHKNSSCSKTQNQKKQATATAAAQLAAFSSSSSASCAAAATTNFNSSSSSSSARVQSGHRSVCLVGASTAIATMRFASSCCPSSGAALSSKRFYSADKFSTTSSSSPTAASNNSNSVSADGNGAGGSSGGSGEGVSGAAAGAASGSAESATESDGSEDTQSRIRQEEEAKHRITTDRDMRQAGRDEGEAEHQAPKQHSPIDFYGDDAPKTPGGDLRDNDTSPAARRRDPNNLVRCIDKEIDDEILRLDKGDQPAAGDWQLQHTEGTSFCEMKREWKSPQGKKETHHVRCRQTVRDPSLDPECDLRGEHCPFQLLIIKQGSKKVMDFQMDVVESELIVDGVRIVDQRSLVLDKTHFGHYDRSRVYPGPDLNETGEEVLDAFEIFLQERGIDDQMGELVLEVSTYYEQLEYERWLKQLKDFVQI